MNYYDIQQAIERKINDDLGQPTVWSPNLLEIIIRKLQHDPVNIGATKKSWLDLRFDDGSEALFIGNANEDGTGLNLMKIGGIDIANIIPSMQNSYLGGSDIDMGDDPIDLIKEVADGIYSRTTLSGREIIIDSGRGRNSQFDGEQITFNEGAYTSFMGVNALFVESYDDVGRAYGVRVDGGGSVMLFSYGKTFMSTLHPNDGSGAFSSTSEIFGVKGTLPNSLATLSQAGMGLSYNDYQDLGDKTGTYDVI